MSDPDVAGRTARAGAAILALLLPAIAAGCAALNAATSEKALLESRGYSLPREVVWRESLEVVRRMFTIAHANIEEGMFESDWRVSPSPFSRLGHRRRVEGELEEEDGLQKLSLRVRVERNDNIEAPLDVRHAEWMRDDDDASAARVLLSQIETSLRKLEREAAR